MELDGTGEALALLVQEVQALRTEIAHHATKRNRVTAVLVALTLVIVLGGSTAFVSWARAAQRDNACFMLRGFVSDYEGPCE